jgi:tRNA threonylcarbamoyladenosine biosynthesis protein TsaB
VFVGRGKAGGARPGARIGKSRTGLEFGQGKQTYRRCLLDGDIGSLQSAIRNPQSAICAVLILAFDTSGFAGSVALLDGAKLLRESALPSERRSAQMLAPAIARLLADEGAEPRQVRLVATTVGPGSFTGLRVGITTAKTFAYAVGAEVTGISTLEAIAWGVPGDLLGELLGSGEREVHAVLDAQRRELFVGKFRVDLPASAAVQPRIIRVEADRIVPLANWFNQLSIGTIVTGAGLAKLEQQLPAGVVIAPRDCWEPRASVVGQIAWSDYQGGRRDDLWKLAPMYLRPSYAEEKAATGGRGV